MWSFLSRKEAVISFPKYDKEYVYDKFRRLRIRSFPGAPGNAGESCTSRCGT